VAVHGMIPAAPPAPARLAGDVRARRPRVVVVGDALLDGWLSGPTHRLGRDAPVPVVELAASSTAPGGAANVAANLAALGADVELITVFGDDADGSTLRASLAEHGVRLDRSVIEMGRPTPAKRRLVAAGQPVARYDTIPDRPPRRSTEVAVADALTQVCGSADGRSADAPRGLDGRSADAPRGLDGRSADAPRGLDGRSADAPRGPDAMVVADYGLGVLGPRVRRRLERLRRHIALLVVDAHDLAPWAALSPDAVTPSAAEAAALLGEPPPVRDRLGWALRRHRELVDRAGAGEVLLTLDVDGALRLPAGGTPRRRSAARPVPESLACGAGDTFVAGWTAAAGAGAGADEALAFAQAAADVAVDLPGTAVCTTAALTARLAAADAGRILERRELLAVLGEHRRAGHRIVFTNGCFDVLHRGHVAYLRQARELGDVLVVALNGDASVSRLKGPQRPVNPLEDRAGVVGAIDAVDLVTWFDEDTPVGLLELVRPDVYAKGGDYTPQMLPETPVVERLGGEVRVLDYLSDHSTSAIVARIRTTATP
jgi:D-beta-D-heptose 7-phosphate kinase/D-beta-D-heptose 1-phosphate adenosyltransferase